MLDPRIRLKQPWLAGILAFLLPGAGHLYQGRYFKAVLYSVCILGLFFTGMAMAEWQAVQPPPKAPAGGGRGTGLLKYAAQAGVGVPALIGLIQRERQASPSNERVTSISAPMTVPFEGLVVYYDDSGNHSGEVRGTITLEPSQGQFGKNTVTGRVTGELVEDGEEAGKPITLQLSDHVELAPPVDARKQRAVAAGIIGENGGGKQEIGQLRGVIPRPFWNWFEVPVSPEQEEDLHRRLGKYHELAMVFTWIAGLLNVLAIWDAVEGPAYGYGDENSPEETPETPKS